MHGQSYSSRGRQDSEAAPPPPAFVASHLLQVTITAVLAFNGEVTVEKVHKRAQSLQYVEIYEERRKQSAKRDFTKHVSLLVHFQHRPKPVNVKVFEKRVQVTGLKNDE